MKSYYMYAIICCLVLSQASNTYTKGSDENQCDPWETQEQCFERRRREEQGIRNEARRRALEEHKGKGGHNYGADIQRKAKTFVVPVLIVATVVGLIMRYCGGSKNKKQE